MGIAELQSYGFLVLTILLTVGLYSYIYHLYKNRKDVDGHDYEDYGNLALKDDLTDTPVNAKDREK
jgi:cbb3-type cytochrome c oxidase CcoQ subunit